MKKHLFCFVAALLTLPCCLTAQRYTLSGSVRDAESGESLIGATVYCLTAKTGTSTNTYGFYSLTLPGEDSLILAVHYLGYEPQLKKVYFHQNIQIDIPLKPAALSIHAVEVSAAQANDNVTRTQMGVINVPLHMVKSLPAVLGESDVLKVIQLLPGVQSGNEGTTGFFVRGGNADQNLVQLDEATVYNPNHLFGLLSTFNTAAINNVTLIKGGFPAQYGGRLSSVLDITMKEGNDKAFRTEGGIGLISSRLTLEGPVKKERSSFILSGRRTYLDLLLQPFLPKNIETNYHFYDLNAKINYRLGQNDRVYLSFFSGNDRLRYKQSGIQYAVGFGNTTATLRWNHLFGPRLFSNTSVLYNQYNNAIEALQSNVRSDVQSGIEDISVKTEFQYFPAPEHTLRFGTLFQHHQLRSEGDARFNPGTKPNGETPVSQIPKKTFDEAAFYLSDAFRVLPRVTATAGLRCPLYVADSFQYFRLEPRLSLLVGLNDRTSIKAAYTVMNQFIHLIPGTAASIPYDIWAPSTARTRPQWSQQFALGLFRNFRENRLEASLEFYYKDMKNQALFKEGNQLVQSLDLDRLLSYGKGWSYGAELLVQKRSGSLSGWLSYTLSWTKQQFAELNFGNTFPFRYDRRHNLAVTGNYAFNEHWSVSSVFVFTSGVAFTVPTGRIQVQNGGGLFEGNYFIYESRNNVRLAPYHRLDLSASYKKRRKIFGRYYDSEWVFSLYNVYSRRNPYFVYFEVDPVTDKPKAQQVSLLPIIPSFSFNFKF
ncbi:MAG: TonB-dependent receptor [Saprospiraceae bacterium]